MARLVLVVVFAGLLLVPLLFILLFHGLSGLLSGSLLFSQFHMGWFASDVVVVLVFLASIALLSTFEVVI